MPPSPSNITESVDLFQCYCNTSLCSQKETFSCWTDGLCYASVTSEQQNDVTPIRYGCMNQSQLFPKGNPVHCRTSVSTHRVISTLCCRQGALCNKDLIPTLSSIPAESEPSGSMHILVICSIVGAALFLFLAILTVLFLVRRRRQAARKLSALDSLSPSGSQESRTSDCDLSAELSDMNSGSGAGYPLLVQRTVAMEIQLEEVVGKGRFGEVWRGRWKGEEVAVKVFHSREEQSWRREAEIYQTTLLQHRHILRFIAADNKDSGTWTQLWLVTEYHSAGSLFDYLNTTALNVGEALKFCESIASGLSHLHVDIRGTSGKPSIAHRDLKSKNILVKSDGYCCIADLGLAVRRNLHSNKVDIAPNTREGTRRYMAPEVLQDAIDSQSLEAYLSADIYSLSLVYWEILNRCYTDKEDKVSEYELPYFDMVDSDPTLEEMYQIVVQEKKRPKFSENINKSEILQSLSRLIREGWNHSPAGRLIILRIRKSLADLLNNHRLQSQL